MKLQEKESTNYVEFHTELHTEYEKLNKIKKRDFSLNFFSAKVLLRIYTSASASTEASPSPASPDRSPRVVLRVGCVVERERLKKKSAEDRVLTHARAKSCDSVLQSSNAQASARLHAQIITRPSVAESKLAHQ